MADLEKQERGMGNLAEGKTEEERFLEGVTVLDFDVLCSTVALQSQGKWRKLEKEEDGDEVAEFGGVFRMWEREVLDCFEDRRIFIESACCPCHRFGKNMRRAVSGSGSCFIQGTVYLILALGALINCIAFVVSKRHCFLYLSLAFTISVGTFLGFFRTMIRKKFNIRGGDTSFDDCIYHLICPCCTLAQDLLLIQLHKIQSPPLDQTSLVLIFGPPCFTEVLLLDPLLRLLTYTHQLNYLHFFSEAMTKILLQPNNRNSLVTAMKTK